MTFFGRVLVLKAVTTTKLGCPKMTQLLKCLAPRADSGAKILVFMEIRQKDQIE